MADGQRVQRNPSDATELRLRAVAPICRLFAYGCDGNRAIRLVAVDEHEIAWGESAQRVAVNLSPLDDSTVITLECGSVSYGLLRFVTSCPPFAQPKLVSGAHTSAVAALCARCASRLSIRVALCLGTHSVGYSVGEWH